MTCSLSLICQTKPPAAPWIWSGSRRNHCGTALRMIVAWAAWAAIAVAAAAEGFLDLLADLLADDFFEGIIDCGCFRRREGSACYEVCYF